VTIGSSLLILAVVLGGAWAVTAVWRSRNDLTRAYDALRISNERNRAVIDTASDAFVSLDEAGRVTDWNQQAELLFGRTREEALGGHVTEMMFPEHLLPAGAPGLARFLRRGKTGLLAQRMELRAQASDGRQFPVEVTAWHLEDRGVLSHHGFIEDTSDRHRLEAELRQAQKLESMGQLAAGIAHEINTPIQFIGDNVRFLGDACDEFVHALEGYVPAGSGSPDMAYLISEVPSAVRQTLEGVSRVATIVRAMKAFGHPSSEQKIAADLNQAVRNTLVMANNELKYVADVVTDLGDLPPVWCHPGDINQVVLNLVVNAAHAIGDVVGTTGERGTITVRTRHEGDHVAIDVADTGTGIAPAVAEHVFEPFFTTKEVGAGTGQGLALAYSLVTDRHNGRLTFTTQPGTGTTFTVQLPVGAPGPTSPADTVSVFE
jgi:PAS domain S-box-containing protein